MNLELTDEQTLIIAMVRRFVREEILPLEINIDPDADSLEPEDQARLIGITKSMGLYGLDIPPEYGGPDIDLITRTLIAVEMAPLVARASRNYSKRPTPKKKPTFTQHSGAKNAGFLVCLNPPADQTPPEPSRPKPFGLVMTGSSTALNCGSAALTAPILDLFSHGPAKTRVAMASPVLSLIPTPLGFMSGVSCTRFARRTTRPSCSLRTWSCPTATSWAR
jgi:hypothetical protein